MSMVLDFLFAKKLGRRIVSASLALLSVIWLTFALFTVKSGDEPTTLISQIYWYSNKGVAVLAVVITAGVELLMGIGFAVYAAIKGKMPLFGPILWLMASLACIILGQSFGFFSAGHWVMFLLSILFIILTLAYVIAGLFIHGPEEEAQMTNTSSRINYRITLVLNIIGLLALSSIFFIPLYTGIRISDETKLAFLIIEGFSGTKELPILLSFIGCLILYIASCGVFTNVLKYYYWKDKRFSYASKVSMYMDFVITILFFIVGNVIVFVSNTEGKLSDCSTMSYIPFLILAILTMLHSFFNSRNEFMEKDSGYIRNSRKAKWIILLFVALFTLVTILTLAVDFIVIYDGENQFFATQSISMSGFDLLMQKEGSEGDAWQVVTFIMFAVLLLAIVMFVLTFTAVFTKNNEVKRLGLATIIMDFFFVVVIGLFGKYYQIAEKINIEMINSYFKQHFPSYAGLINYSGRKIGSTSFYMIFVDVILAIGLFLFRPFTKAEQEGLDGEITVSNKEAEPLKVELTNEESIAPQLVEEKEEALEVEKEEEITLGEEKTLKDFDACPSFTELDSLEEEFNEKLEERKALLFENPTLPEITKFIVDYARESRLHLSYTHEDIAAFIAGLGATKLSILQGMSGTGKTSLPKIFLEALMGNCEIVEVESSWKDKNELLGYYNEFSKTFTPKKFTRALYKASLNKTVITFIVLDEMNLSRIEYYFSDFLSLMENEPQNREIQLCNVKLFNTYDQERHTYKGLQRGHTLHIPENVWFIGTANRDESTFEISDKVYDRAHTMNFNKRAPKVRSFTKEISKRYLPYEEFQKLLSEAVATQSFDLESVSYLKDLEELLRPYNISFGNRIMNQIEAYVKIYASCFNEGEESIDEALERILLSKVVSKLEFKAVEDKESLIRGFEKMKLYKCSEFVKGLNEDF